MQLTSQGPNPELKRLFQSPYGISDMFVEKVKREIEHAAQGKTARVVAKVNGLSSPAIINSLYQASQAGVTIELVVRGICCLRPGVEGLSENISVRSVVGRFLEHARVFYFENGDDDSELFLSSADLMPRNLRNRIEQCTPILDSAVKAEVINDLEIYLSDQQNSWLMQADGGYSRVLELENDNSSNTSNNDVELDENANEAVNAQQSLLEKHSDKY